MPAPTRILIVNIDALRPEFVTRELMPNLTAFAARGVSYANSHSTFFTETRVNQSTVVTGCLPRRHGVVANKFVADAVSPGRVLNTGIEAEIAAAFTRAGGRLFDVPTLPDLLAASGLTYASLSAGTPGGGRLINYSADRHGTFRLAMRAPEACHPPNTWETIVGRFGELPAQDKPLKDWITRAVDIYLGYVEPEHQPDVMLLWLCEPDETFHYLGIGSEASRETIRHTDAEFGRMLAHHREAIAAGRMQIIAMSDHGQITLEGERLGITARLQAAGFHAGEHPGPGVDCVFVGANAGGIWVRDGDPALRAELTRWLLGEDWCGPLFTSDGALGTLSTAAVGLDHPRGPDIALTMRTRADANAHGSPGLSLHDAPYPVGGGCHGGLSRQELHNVLTLGGAAFKSATHFEALPAGNIDVTPTVLALLGLDVPAHCNGRVLREAFTMGPAEAEVAWTSQSLASGNAVGPRTVLSLSEVGQTRYLDEARIE